MSTPQKSPPGNRNSPRSPKSPDNAKSPKSPGHTGNNPSIDQSLSQMSISESTKLIQVAKRPGSGSVGIPIKAKVNFYHVDVSKTPPVFDYAITINSKDKQDRDVKSKARSRVVQLLLKKPGFEHAASDYSNRIVSTKQIEAIQGQEYICDVDYFEPEEGQPRSGARNLQYKVSIKQTGQFTLGTLVGHLANPKSVLTDMERYTSALNIFFSRYYSQNSDMATTARRAKFFNVGSEAESTDLKMGLDVVLGYFRAVKTTINGLMLNVNTAAAVMFHTGLLSTLIQDMNEVHSGLSLDRKLASLSGELKGLRVTHSFFGYPMRKTVLGVAIQRDQKGSLKTPTAGNITFMRDKHPKTKRQENKQVTVFQHFRDAYPNARTSEATWVVNLGNKDQPNFVPSDLLEVLPGNFYRGLVPHPSQGSTMIRRTCRLPGANKELIQKVGLQQLGVTVENTDGPQARFNIVVNSNMMTVKARVLPGPEIMFSKSPNPAALRAIHGGKWNMKDVKFKTSCSAVNISWLEFSPKATSSAKNLKEFKAGIVKGFKDNCSVNTQFCTLELENFSHTVDLSEPIDRNKMHTDILWPLKRANVRLVFVILPDKNADLYSLVKMAGDTMTGIHTICTVLKSGLIKTGSDEIGNLMLKVNMKLGGVNLMVQPKPDGRLYKLLSRRIMFVGADVGHPAPGSMEGAPSIAGVVATTDQSFFRYAGAIRLQNHFDQHKKSVEFIAEFREMMEGHLKLYQTRNRQILPETIVVYRDGVADNMFTECVNNEVMQIQAACRKIYPSNALPKLVFIVAQKRHHTRFYQEDTGRNNAFDAKGNPNPGFIVDSEICDTRLWDWYLISHKCLQGTSRAAHYTVLHNETDFSVDELQLLTHYQCWLLGRSSTSISIHPAARHADLLCDRARVYLRSVYVPKVNKPYLLGEHWPGHFHAQMKDEMYWV